MSTSDPTTALVQNSTALVAVDDQPIQQEDDELAALKAKLTTLRKRDEAMTAELKEQWEKHWEQDAFYREAEQKQAEMDDWSQDLIRRTMERQSAQIQQELQSDAQAAEARLRLPPLTDEVRAIESARRSEKVLRIRDADARRNQLSIQDRAAS